jgi:EAL domain-containing protein (putative c-di-GMP-specific phosphodiesterase class I)
VDVEKTPTPEDSEIEKYLNFQKKEVLKLLDLDAIVIYFQPIVFVKGTQIVGVEALARGIKSNQIIPPNIIFSQAEEKGIKIELDRVCRDIAFREFRKLYEKNPDLVLFFNFDGSVIDLGARNTGFIFRMAKKHNLPPQNIVIEITETKVKNFEALKEFVENYKKLGFLIALDDVGVEYSNLNRIPELKPHILKIDRLLVKDLEKEYYKEKVIKALVYLAKEIGALTLAEGIETEGEVLKTLEIGINFCQGFYFSKPSPLKSLSIDGISHKFNFLVSKFHFNMINYFQNRKKLVKSWKNFVKEILEDLNKVPKEEFEKVLQHWINKKEDIECLYIVNMEGTVVTNTVFAENIPVHKSPIFTPASFGKNLLLRDYVYPIVSGLFESFITEPYVSLATGNVVVTVSFLFLTPLKEKFILCADFRPNL